MVNDEARKNVSPNEIYLIYILRKLIVRASHKYFPIRVGEEEFEEVASEEERFILGGFSLLGFLIVRLRTLFCSKT